MTVPPEESTFKILIATDIHLGYAEKDNIRGEDTFNSLKEVLQIAKREMVDYILLGGDLFHENKPSAKCMTKCAEYLRQYCMGDNPVKFAVVSNQKVNFSHSNFEMVNYEDENLNIGMPVFSIHGNHDDPIGRDPICAIEMLSASGLVNYFGKYTDMEQIDVSPILMTKGNTKLALYGFGSLPEERLHRFFIKNKINFLAPSEDSDSWFKLFIVHQNRASRSATAYLPTEFLSNLPDLVVWGHEHESFDTVDWNDKQRFYIYQPGSTVVTSLCPGEARPKHVGLLEVFHDGSENKFRVKPIPLVSPRRLYFEDVNIAEIFSGTEKVTEEMVENYCVKKVEDMILVANQEHSGNKIQPKAPLIRLRVQLSDEYQAFSVYRFGQKFVGKVANPKEIVLFKRTRSSKFKEKVELGLERIDEMMEADTAIRFNIEDVVKQYFEETDDKNKLNLLNEMALTEGVKAMVEKEASVDTLSAIIDLHLSDVQSKLQEQRDLNVDNRLDVIAAFRKRKEEKDDEKSAMEKKIQEVFRKYDSTENGTGDNGVDEYMESKNNVSLEDDEEFASAPIRGRGKDRKGRSVARKPRATRGKATNSRKRERDVSPPSSSDETYHPHGSTRSSPRKKQSLENTLLRRY